jgi:lysine 2,3-aminomutase
VNTDSPVAHKLQQSKNLVETEQQLYKFLHTTLPDEVPLNQSGTRMQTRDEFIHDVFEGITAATMAVRMT